MSPNRVHPVALDGWTPDIEAARSGALCRVLEHGSVLYLPRLRFEILPAEAHLLSEGRASEDHKNISLRDGAAELRGARGTAADLAALHGLMARYASMARQLVTSLIPRYAAHLRRGSTSFRPCKVEARILSWRRDDTRLHVDSFPSNPVRGRRILRVFSNVHPGGRERTWLIGVPFPSFAQRFMPRTRPALPGSSWALAMLGITKCRRSEYDHRMLQLHDCAKADGEFQRNAPRQEFRFAAGSTWIAFTDQVVHAATAGQYALEQTLYLDLEGMRHRAASPLAVLEALAGRTLV